MPGSRHLAERTIHRFGVAFLMATVVVLAVGFAAVLAQQQQAETSADLIEWTTTRAVQVAEPVSQLCAAPNPGGQLLRDARTADGRSVCGTAVEIRQGIPGRPGTPGREGIPGRDGVNGADGEDGRDGKDGSNGLDGKDGAPGKDAPVVRSQTFTSPAGTRRCVRDGGTDIDPHYTCPDPANSQGPTETPSPPGEDTEN